MKKILKKIIYILSASQKLSLVKIFFISILSAIFEIFSIGLIIPILTIFLNNDYQKYANYLPFVTDITQKKLLVIVLLLFLVVYFAKVATNLLLIFKNNLFKEKLFVDLSKRLLKGYLNRDVRDILANNSAIIIRNVSTESVLFSYGMILSLIILSTELVVFLAIISSLFIYNFKVSLIILTYFGIFGLFLYFLNSKRLRTYGSLRQKYNALTLKELQQSLGSIKEIFLYGLQDLFLKSFNEKLIQLASSTKRRDNIIQTPKQLFEFVGIISILSIILISYLYVNLPLSEIFIVVGVFVFASVRLMPGIAKILNSFQNIKYNFPVVDLIYDEFKKNKDLNISPNIDNLNNKKFTFENISLNNLNFTYNLDNEKNIILKNLNLKINKGDKIGISGESGSGKSTIINIICGFFKPEKGNINVNNEDIEKNKYIYQKKIGYVPQSIFLTDETLLFNITLKKNDGEIDYERLNKILEITNLNQIIEELDQGLNTFLGERGSNLSGGQVQRVGIARALYRDPEILIFDEATNALDAKNQKLILNNVFDFMKDKTVIIVSHDEEALKFSDNKFVLQNKSLIKIK